MTTVVDGIAAAGLQETEALVLQQYERIIRFRDEILAGKHATIQLPESLRNGVPSPQSPNARNESRTGSLPAQNNQAFASNVQYAVGQSSTDLRAIPAIAPRSILLSKSDELLCVELQLQRMKIEKELQEDLQQTRHGKQGGAGPQDGINASAILAAALLRVPERTFVQAEEAASSGNAPENDSFDDNTFYSSQHDTPEFQPASPVLVPLAGSAAASSVQPSSARAMPSKVHDERRNNNHPRQLRSYGELVDGPTASQPPSKVPGLTNHVDNAGASLGQSVSTAQVASGPVSRPVAAAQPLASRPAPTQPTSYADLHPPSPLLQGKKRPAPTQPVQHPRPNEIPGLYGNVQNAASNVGAPAQVAALRSEPGSRTSPESSSQGGQNKRKNRRKKRKSDRQGFDGQQSFENSPQHIKAEPRSPSPIAGPSYLRPNKRQRQLKPQTQNPPFDEMTYDPAMPSAPANGTEGPQRPSYRQERATAGYEGSGVYSATGAGIPASARVSREYVTERVITDDGYRREFVSQSALPYEYSSRGSHIARPVQQIVGRHDSYQDGPLSYRSSPQATRYSVLPEGDTFHEPARSQPARILVDAYGREYFEPARQIIRHSIAPSPLPVETERVYERAPPQPVSRYQGQGPLEERGYMFAQPASPYSAPRRIITQPEYITFDNREGRYREFSARPLATTPGEFIQVRSQEHRAYADGGREYISRASSMHPAEQTRISSGLGSYGHASSVRPEASGVIYGIERSVPLSGIKSYGPWPTSQGVVEREGGSSAFVATAANEATSSRSATGQDPMYGRVNRSDGFR